MYFSNSQSCHQQRPHRDPQNAGRTPLSLGVNVFGQNHKYLPSLNIIPSDFFKQLHSSVNQHTSSCNSSTKLFTPLYKIHPVCRTTMNISWCTVFQKQVFYFHLLYSALQKSFKSDHSDISRVNKCTAIISMHQEVICLTPKTFTYLDLWILTHNPYISYTSQWYIAVALFTQSNNLVHSVCTHQTHLCVKKDI